ncbi:MAG: branched-chain-amino-acid transaminase [Verrucomicrobia bacterium]|nr:branched-chain-amino-acid transaminase [Verrucomicrobiota bacterium]MDA1065495.1 branched-chain-amino-acid transaminase [Verrucomicrobiota bacterium]
MKVFLDGQFVESEDAKISVFDHGLLYGDGIFEGIRLYNNCVFKLKEHLERLEYSAKAVMLEMPWSRQVLSDAVCETCRINNLKDGYIRLVVTRGRGSLGLSPKSCVSPSIFIIADNLSLYPPEYYEKGLEIITVPTRRINPSAMSPAVKSLNYLNNILAKMEADRLGYIEALMLNDQGYVAECTGDNVFIFHKGKLMTPPFSAGALKGVTREVVLEIAESLGVPVSQENLTRYDIWIAEECFLTGTAAEVIPVVEVDGRKIGDGKPGKVTGQFLAEFRSRVAKEGTFL